MSADTIVPGYANPQNLNRYRYVSNNPLRYTDPTGHMLSENEYGGGCSTSGYCPGGTAPQPPSNPPGGGKGGGGHDEDDDPTPTVIPGPTPTIMSTSCPMVLIACIPTSTPTPTPTITPSPTSTPEFTIGPNHNPAWEFPYTIIVTDPFDLVIDIAGLVGDGASVVGVPGKIAWGITEVAEVVGIGKDIYDLAANSDPTGISSTFFFQAAAKLVPDVMRISSPGAISVAGNVWSISQNITITPK